MSADRADATLEALLEFVKETRGFDFTGYKRTTIQRRVTRRMATVGVERYDDYLDYLELHGEEFAELFNALLINTTGFFRDPQTWEYLATEVAPQLLAARPAEAPIRVWCAGCASGEEPYTVAMVLARVMGDADVPRIESRSTPPTSTRRLSISPGRAPMRRARSRTCRTMRSSASSSAPTSATCSARTCGAA